MLRNHIKTFSRNFRKYKTFSTINLVGLATGIAVALLMALYMNYELSYDRHFDDQNRLFRVIEVNLEDASRSRAGVHFPIAPLLEQDHPEIEWITRIHPLLPRAGSVDDKVFMESGFILADPSFFKVFQIKALQGSTEDALSNPTDMVINASTAYRYFGDNWMSESVIGKSIRVKNSVDYQVVAVVPDFPANSHFDFDILLPFGKVYGSFITNNWNFSSFYTYTRLKEAADVNTFRENLAEFTARYYPEDKKNQLELDLQTVKSIHLNSALTGELEANSNYRQVYLFGAIGLLILGIAAINFINLTTAMASRRHKEIGMKKVLGARRSSLIKQYLVETTFLTFLAALLAIGIVDISINAFNNLGELDLKISTLWKPGWIAAISMITFILGLFSGLYPAFYISSLNPLKALKGGPIGSIRNARLRKFLVTLQFTITTCLIIAVLTVFQQLNYLGNKDLGFEKEGVAMLRSHPKVNQDFAVFRNELIKLSAIEEVGFTYGNLLGGGSFSVRALLDQNGGDEVTAVPLLYSDYSLLQTMGLEMKEGRWFSRDFATDTTEAFVINETAAQAFGWQEDALNKEIRYFGGGTTSIEKKGRVVGIVKDFFHESLHEKLEPLIITLSHTYVPTFPNCFIPIKIKGADMKTAIAEINQVWDQQNTGVPLDLKFLDNKLDQLYEKDQRLGDILNASALLALMIASIGVFGLASFTVTTRVKEIGIRKVLGARVDEVLIMMIRGFLKPVAVAFLIAIPASIYFVTAWLENFAYHISLGVGLFLLTMVISMAIAISAVLGQSLKAARTNPVNVLRND